jgi:hypothetical protein
MSLGEYPENRPHLFTHTAHPWREQRAQRGPVKVVDQHRTGGVYARFNAWLAVHTTAAVGSMTCAYLFTLVACISLPAAISSHNVIVIVSWFAQTLVQLVLLSVIMVGQGIQGAAADKRGEQTYLDAEAILHSADQIAQHLTAQDAHLLEQDGKLADLVTRLTGQGAGAPGAARPDSAG